MVLCRCSKSSSPEQTRLAASANLGLLFSSQPQETATLNTSMHVTANAATKRLLIAPLLRLLVVVPSAEVISEACPGSPTAKVEQLTDAVVGNRVADAVER